MNYLAHLFLARDDEELMLGGLLGDFVRGQVALRRFAPGIQAGILLHRRIDRYTDEAPETAALKELFPAEFRRYAGIILDLAFDHELARRWVEFSEDSLADFDAQVRSALARHPELSLPRLRRFMAYADRRGLFAAYRLEKEMLHSLAGIGSRLRRRNPLFRVHEIWPGLREPCRRGFAAFFPRLQSCVPAWLNLRSITTGS